SYHLDRNFHDGAQSFSLSALERRVGQQPAHGGIPKNHAHDDEKDQLEGLKNKVQKNAMLQLHLVAPLTVNRGQLLTGLDPVVVNRKNLSLGAAILKSGKRNWTRLGSIGGGIGLPLERIVLGRKRPNVALRLLLRLVDH